MVLDDIDAAVNDGRAVIGMAAVIAFYALAGSRTIAGSPRFFVPLIAAVYVTVPLISTRIEDGETFRRVFAYAAVLPGMVVVIASIWGLIGSGMAVLVLFVLAGTGYWLWAVRVYAAAATDIYVDDRMTKERLGMMFVPLFTGTPLAVVLLFIGVMEGLDWATMTGLVLAAGSALTLSSLLRNR